MGKKGGGGPDVVGASDVDRKTARDITYADRADQYNPFGSLTYTTEKVGVPGTETSSAPGTPATKGRWQYPGEHPGDRGDWIPGKPATSGTGAGYGEYTTKWTQNQQLDPSLQGAADATFGMMDNQASTDRYNSQTAMDKGWQVQNEMGGQANFNRFGDVVGFDPAAQRQAAEDAAYGKSTMRLGDRFNTQTEALEVKMRNQGLRPGDQAYDSQMKTLGNERNDAYTGARFDSVGAGRDEFSTAMQGNNQANALRNQQIEEYIAKRGFSLSEQKALNEGQASADITSMVTG